jgi:hypothetical protein
VCSVTAIDTASLREQQVDRNQVVATQSGEENFIQCIQKKRILLKDTAEAARFSAKARTRFTDSLHLQIFSVVGALQIIQINAAATAHNIIAGTTVELIISGFAIQNVVIVSTEEAIIVGDTVAGSAIQYIFTRFAVNPVISVLTIEHIVSSTSEETIISNAAREEIHSAAASDQVVTSTPVERCVPGESICADVVCGGSTDDRRRSQRTDKGIRLEIAETRQVIDASTLAC